MAAVTRGRALRLAVGVALAASFAWLLFRGTSAQALGDVVAHTRPGWLALALVAFAAGYAVRIERWRRMLLPDNPALRWRHCAGPLLAGFAANNLLPFRAGDLLRAFAFNRTLGTSPGPVIASLFVERVLDTLMVLAVLALSLPLLGAETARFAAPAGAALAAIAAALLFVLLVPASVAPAVRAGARVAARVSPRLGERIGAEADRALGSLAQLARRGTMGPLVGLSALAWSAEGLVFWCAALAVPSLPAPAAAWVAFPVATLATLIPSTPGYVGTFDWFAARAMIGLGNPADAATVYALLVHVLVWLPPTVVGGLYWLAHALGRRHDAARLHP